jgi:hypothetical protein
VAGAAASGRGPGRPETDASDALATAGLRFALVPGAAQVMRVFDIARMRERPEFIVDSREVTAGT